LPVEVEAVFDDEDRLQSAAQIFRTAQRAKQLIPVGKALF
jgi:hypothetical protein